MRALPIVSMLLLGGCWPLIPGSWEDYDIPEETQVVGQFAFYEMQGGYWDDDSPFGSAWFAWLEQPDAEVRSSMIFHESGEGCKKGAVDLDWLTDRFSAVGDDEAQIQHPSGRLDLPWNSNLDFFYTSDLTDDDVEPDAQYDLVQLPIDGVPTYVEGFVSLPQSLDYDGPDLDGDAPEAVGAEDLAWSWDPAAAAGQSVVIEVVLVDSASNVLEQVACIADGSAGEIKVPASIWDQLEDGVGWQVYQQNLREAHAKVETETEGVGSSRMAGVRGKVGFLELN